MSGNDDEMMTIGEFATRSRLSLKALRIYDCDGLLVPAVVDPTNGYRYYEPEQIEKARMIGLLRRLEMPLREIAEVVDLDDEEAAPRIATFWDGVESELRVRRDLVHYLRNRLTGKGAKMYTIEQRQVPATRFVSIQRHLTAEGLPTFISEAMDSMFGAIETSDATVSGAAYVVYHGEVNTDSDGPVEVCIPYDGELNPVGEMRIGTHPAHEEAFTRIAKMQVDFPVILEAYNAVENWIRENDRDLVQGLGPRETYFTDFGDAGPDDPVCDIGFPLAN